MHDVPLPVKAVVKAPLWLLVMITISGTLAMHMFVPALPAGSADLWSQQRGHASDH